MENQAKMHFVVQVFGIIFYDTSHFTAEVVCSRMTIFDYTLH